MRNRIGGNKLIAAAVSLGLALGLWAGAAGIAFAAPGAVDFGPVDTHREVRQVWLRFSDDMAALGDSKAPDAADVVCEGTKEVPVGHWLDARRWVAEFRQPLGDGIRCEVKPRALTSLQGTSMAAAAPWYFDTGGPRLHFYYDTGAQGQAKEDPTVIVGASAPLDDVSLRYLACKVNGESRPVEILKGTDAEHAADRIVQQRRIGAPAQAWYPVRCGNKPWPNDAAIEMVADARIASAAHVANRSDEVFKFKVRPSFIGQLSCARLLGSEGCDPRLQVQPSNPFGYNMNQRRTFRLHFSEAIPDDMAAKIVLVDEKGVRHAPEPLLGAIQTQEVDFVGEFAEGEALKLQLPADLHDIDGRAITNRSALGQPFPLARLPAYLGMPQPTGIVPWTPGKSASWPVVTRALEAQVPVAAWHFGGDTDDAVLLKLLHAEVSQPKDVMALSEHSDTPYAASLRLLDSLGNASQHLPAREDKQLLPTHQSVDFTPLALQGYGMWLVEADSPAYRAVVAQQRAALVEEAARQKGQFQGMPLPWLNSRFAVVQVTNLRAEALNSGKGDSLIWVTAIASGEPVAGAHVDLWTWSRNTALAKLGTFTSDAQGRVVVPASAGWNNDGGRVPMMVVRFGSDTLVANVQAGWDGNHDPIAHTLLDRVLLHPGETVSMQHIVRQLTREGLIVPPMDDRWKLQIFDGYRYSSVKPVYEQALAWSEAGSADSNWKIPADAKLGTYSYRLSHTGPDGSVSELAWGSFQVEEFRTPSFDATLESQPQWKGESQGVTLRGALSYMSGGAAAGQDIHIKGHYAINRGSPVQGYTFFEPPWPEPKLPSFDDLTLTLDSTGHAQADVSVPAFAWPLTLETEMSFADPNGETKSEQSTAAIWPQRHKVGMRLARSGDTPDDTGIKAQLIALDEHDQPLTALALTVNLLDPDGKSTPACRLKTDAQGKAECRLGDSQAQLSGKSAEVKADGASGVSLKIDTHFFGYQQAGKPVHQTLELPKDRPLLGAALPVHIRSPFLPATLLLTVERQGVQRSLVQKITRSDEVIALPTGADDAPSVELRALLVPAADAKSADGQAWSGAIEQASAGVWFAEASGSLTVSVKPVQAMVLPGSSVKVALKATLTDSGRNAAHAHVTVAVVDDALLAMKPNNTWDLLQSYWRRAGSDVAFAAIDDLMVGGLKTKSVPNYFPVPELALQRQWIAAGLPGINWLDEDSQMSLRARGAESFALMAPAPVAAAPAREASYAVQKVEITGSNISRADLEPHVKPRSNFSTLALWRTDVVLDEHGEADVTVPMPDTLTRWYIAAIATSGAARFGTGQADVTTSQPVQILSGLPQSVRSDDVLVQKLTLRNTTAKPLTLALTAQAQGQRDDNLPGLRDPMPAAALEARGLTLSRHVALAAGENKIVQWQVSVPTGVTALEWHIAAKDAKGHTLDALVQTQSVTAAVPVTVREASLLAVDQPKQVTIAQPEGAKPGLGGVAVKWQDSLVAAAMDGTRRAMAAYPYGCMEQLASKAVVSGDPAQWKQLMAKLPAMLDAQGLVRYFPETPGSEVLTAYLIDIAEAYGLPLPQEEERRMRAGLRNALASEVPRDQAEWLDRPALLTRRLALQATLAPDMGSAAPVISTELDKLPTIGLVDWLRYLLKQADSPERASRLEAASDELRNRYDMQGTRISLRPNANDNNWWFMWNGDVAEARAGLMIEQNLAQQPRWQGLLPSLIGGLVDRQQAGHWHTTVANAWSGAALQAFAAKNEHGTVSGTSYAGFGGHEVKSAWPNPVPALLPWPQQGARGDLSLRHEGQGAPWATVQVTAAVATPESVSHGLSVKKVIEPLEQKVKGRWSVGDILRVTLTMQSDARLSWLAVRDPIPSGATIQGKGLKGETQLGHPSGWLWWWNPSSAELGNESYRGYYQFTWGGTWQAQYVLRLNNAGTFTLPPTRIEAMYAPEIFGEMPNPVMQVGP